MCLVGLLHWFTSPYVHRLEYDRQSKTVRAQTLSLLAQPVESRFHEAEVQYPDTLRPQVTFQVANPDIPAFISLFDATIAPKDNLDASRTSRRPCELCRLL